MLGPLFVCINCYYFIRPVLVPLLRRFSPLLWEPNKPCIRRCRHVFGTLTKLSLSFAFHNVLGTLWARFVGYFEKHFYLFLQLSHFVRGICLAEVEHKISQLNGVGIAFYSVKFFLKHFLIFFTLIFPFCRKVVIQHCDYHKSSTLSMNATIIL